MIPALQICTGDVVHQRRRPRVHKLSYRVFSLLTDVDRLEESAQKLRLFSYNRHNLLSIWDRDHLQGEGKSIGSNIRATLAQAGVADPGGRILMLAYPRVAGYVFNPLSVFYVFDRAGELHTLVYEVNNTFSERTSYVVPAGAGRNGVYAQACDKTMHVSPFAAPRGRYGFRVTDPAGADVSKLTVGVQFHDNEGPLIRTHFRAAIQPVSDAAIAGICARMPFSTLKVITAIHWEALKLWFKGVPVVQGHTSQRYTINNAATGMEQGRKA